jgi:hypothetical protein
MLDELGKIDKKEAELGKVYKLTEKKAKALVINEIKKLHRYKQPQEVPKYQKILDTLNAKGGIVSDLDPESFKLLKDLWKYHIRSLALKQVRNKIEVSRDEIRTIAGAALINPTDEENEELGNGAA